MGVKITNNASATLAASISNSATTLTVTTGQGASFPTLTGVDYCWLTLVDTSNNVEVIKCTARSTDSFTIVRAQDNTTARAFAISDRLELRPTAALFDEFANPLSEKGVDIASANPLVITAGSDYFDVTGTTGFAAMTVATNRQFTLQFDGALIMTHHATNLDLPGEANITTVAGDVATFQSTGANTVQCINYTRADGTAIVATSPLAGIDDQSSSNDDQLTIKDSEVVINEDGDDLDFRIEDDGGTHAFFLQGSEGRIGINHSTPDARLEIHPESETGIHVESSVAGETTAQFKGAGTGNVSVLVVRDSADAALFDVRQDGRGRASFTVGFWVRFDGGGTVSIAGSHNVTTIGDWGTGEYGVYIVNGFANANYSTQITCITPKIGVIHTGNTSPQTSRIDIRTLTTDGSTSDTSMILVQGTGDFS